MLYTIGIILAFFLAFLLLTKKSKTQADIILVGWLLTIGVHLFFYSIHITDQHYNYPQTLGFGIPLPLLHGPFLYLYIVSLTSKKQLGAKSLLHFIPFFLCLLLFWDFFLLPPDIKIEIYKNKGLGYELQRSISLVSIILSGVVYIILSVLKLMTYQNNIKNEFSYSEKITLNWLKYLVVGMILIWSFVIFTGNDDYIYTVVVFQVLFMGYYGIKQVGIFTQTPYNNSTSDQAPELSIPKKEPALAPKAAGNKDLKAAELNNRVEVKNKYEKSTLSESKALEIHDALKSIMLSKQLFKNPELALDHLAKALNIHPNHLSQVINSFEEKNFYDYINSLRVAEFIKISGLPENHKFTLLSLAFEVGFNSKTSFNRNFKKATGFTPTGFLKKNSIKLPTH